MNRTEKEQMVSELKSTLEASETVVVVKQSGLTVTESTELRQRCRDLDAGFKVYKNRLVKIAIKGTKFEHLNDSLEGTTALAYSADPIAAAKAVYGFAKGNDKLTLIAGGMGDKALTADEVKAWGALPGLDELRGKIVGLLQAPGGQLARVFNAYSEAGPKEEAPAEAAAETPAEAPAETPAEEPKAETPAEAPAEEVKAEAPAEQAEETTTETTDEAPAEETAEEKSE